MKSRVRLVITFLVSAFVALVAWPVLAAPPGPNALPVHVVAVKSDFALDQAEALTTVLRKAVRNSEGWSLGDSEQSLEFLALKMKCTEPIDAACEQRIAEVLKADRFIWAVIEFEDEKKKSQIVGTVNFFVRGKGTSRHELRYSANLTDPNADALIEVGREAVQAVTGGAPKGTLKVSSGGIAGQIFIDGKPMGALPAEGASFPLPAGEHRVVVKAPGYEDAEGSTTLKPATTSEITLTLLKITESEPLDWRLIGGFGALVVGVGAGAVGLWASLEVNAINNDAVYNDFLATVPEQGGSVACDNARNGSAPQDYGTQFESQIGDIVDKCDKGDTMEIIQAVMYPVGGIAAGVGLYLIMTSDLVAGDGDGADSALRVVPLITQDMGAVTVSYSF
jgi:hypothetical protein